MSNPWQDPQQPQGQSGNNPAGQGSNQGNPYAQPAAGAPGQDQGSGQPHFYQQGSGQAGANQPGVNQQGTYQPGQQFSSQAPQGSGYAPYPGGADGYAPQPSKGTVIAAAVLSFLGVLANVVGIIMLFGLMVALADASKSTRDKLSWLNGYATISIIVSVIVATLLLIGGILLLKGKSLGRVLIVAGCAITIIGKFGEMAANGVIAEEFSGEGVATASFGTFLGIIFPLVTIVLAFLPATKRWLDSRKG